MEADLWPKELFIIICKYTVAVFRHTRRGSQCLLRLVVGWLWATMWLLGFELRTSVSAGSFLNHWAISPAQKGYFFKQILLTNNSFMWLVFLQLIEKLSKMLSKVVVHAFNPSTWETEAGRFMSLRPAWPTKWVPGQPGLPRETLSKKPKKQKSMLSSGGSG